MNTYVPVIKLTDENLMRLNTNIHRRGHVLSVCANFYFFRIIDETTGDRIDFSYLNIVGKIQINISTQFGKIHYKGLAVLGHLKIRIPTYYLFKHRRMIMFLPL